MMRYRIRSTFSTKGKKANKSRLETFKEIAGKIHRVTLQDELYARSLSPVSCRTARYSMQLPNKLYSYKASTLALIPKVLKKLKSGPKEVKDLFLMVRPAMADAIDSLSIMNCLYALRAQTSMRKGAHAYRNGLADL